MAGWLPTLQHKVERRKNSSTNQQGFWTWGPLASKCICGPQMANSQGENYKPREKLWTHCGWKHKTLLVLNHDFLGTVLTPILVLDLPLRGSQSAVVQLRDPGTRAWGLAAIHSLCDSDFLFNHSWPRFLICQMVAIMKPTSNGCYNDYKSQYV